MFGEDTIGEVYRRWCAVIVGCLMALPGGVSRPVSGQSPPYQTVNVKGWVPADRVAPFITVQPVFNSSRKLWIYTYRVRNQSTASQSLIKLALVLNVSVESALAPGGWVAVTYNPPGALPGVTFAAEQSGNGSWPRAARPGGAGVVFRVVSRYGPGTVKLYARGDAPRIALEDLDAEERARLPDEQQDAWRGTTIGPVP
jgi:hypothetical protein